MKATIFHNSRCSKSRQTLDILQQQGADIEIVEYLKTPPDATQIKQLCEMLGIGVRDVMRSGETVYKDLGLGDQSLSDDQLLAAMVENPILIQRPIVVANNQARIGRPPESVLEIVSGEV